LQTNTNTTQPTTTPAHPTKNTSIDQTNLPIISKLTNSKQSPDNIYSVGSDGVWRSTNFGGSWTVTTMPTGWNFSSFTDVEVSRANPKIVWAGSGQFGNTTLFVSTDAGTTFNAVPNPGGYSLGYITRIATHPLEPNTAYALYSYSNYAKILKTTDLGQTWTDISGFGTGISGSIGFPDVAVYCLYVRPDNPNIIWAGTEIGIVETLDGGNSWALLTEFPNVAVWDMKGQDKEIVIATHGRGIWTAELSTDQNGVSNILKYGTSPQAELKVVVNVPLHYDSVRIKINTQYASFIPPDTGTYILKIKNAPTGAVSLQSISYLNGNPTYSPVTSATNFKLTQYQTKYFNYIDNSNDFFLSGFSLQPFGYSNTSLQTAHNYPNNQSQYATLLVPIVVSSSLSNFVYSDVAIVQPGANGSVFGQAAFNDYVIAEATKDGLNWSPIANGYNASANANWLTTFNSKQAGNSDLTVIETFDLKNNFKTNDTILVRFRLTSNADNTVGWGWSIDNLFIQQTPTEVEPVSEEIKIYPNPSTGIFNIAYYLPEQSSLVVKVWDVTGRPILAQASEIQNSGNNQTQVNLESSPPGMYVVQLKTSSFEKTLKVIISR
ncbi:MAG TPA: hypothetical protein DGG95_09385, partial [Cytophagales bacterium]|nr:hypothetical protein [Cytophagales bacterium]